MAQLVVSAAGAAVGFALGGPTGARIGWAVGSIVGSSLGPTQRMQGPRLGDLAAPKLEYGSAIPTVRGRFRLAGTPIWTSAKREIATTTSQGKGGPNVSSTTYTYERDVLYLISDNPGQHLQGVSRIWSNGELVWSALPSSDDASRLASRDTELWTGLRIYTGADGQLPDATYVPDAGVDLAPAYTGRLTVMIEGLQLGNSGQLPLLEFETGNATEAGPEVILQLNFEGDTPLVCEASGVAWSHLFGPAPYASGYIGGDGKWGDAYYTNEPTPNGVTYNCITAGATTAYDLQDGVTDFQIQAWVRFVAVPVGRPTVILRIAQHDGVTNGGKNEFSLYQENNDGTLKFGFHYPSSANNTTDIGDGIALDEETGFGSDVPTDRWFHLVAERKGNTYRLCLNGVTERAVSSATVTYRRPPSQKLAFIGNQGNTTLFDSLPGSVDGVQIVSGIIFDLDNGYTVPTAPPTLALQLTQYSATPLDLADEVQWLCQRAGLQAGDVDATALAGTTLDGYAVTQVTPVRSVLEMLASAYYFECVESDKLYFRPRGGASAATLAWADVGAARDSAPPSDRLGMQRGSDVEVPARVALSYVNIDDDYQAGTVHADRLVGVGGATQTAQLAIAMTPARAAGIAETMVQDQAVAAMSLAPTLPYSVQPRLEPTDVATWTDDEGTTYRARIVRETLDGGVRRLDCVLDDANVLRTSGSTETSYTATVTVRPIVLTDLELLDIPLLRDVDSSPGIYAALQPKTTGKWPGAQLLRTDASSEYIDEGAVGSAAVFGTVVTALTNWTGGNVFDTGGSVTVDVGAGTLASSTRELVLTSQANAMLIGDEVIQFVSASLVSAGRYKLTHMLRGRLGTEHAMAGHVASERAVLLRTAGLLNVTYDAALIGQGQSYRAVTVGRPVESAVAQNFADTGVRLKPWAPADLRLQVYESDDIDVTWRRRTRLSWLWLNAAGTAAPLGEASEAYEVVVSLVAGADLRTISATSPTVTYTAAMQAADGTSPASALRFTVYQMSATVGRGYPASIDI